jgi:hypothetical protein
LNSWPLSQTILHAARALDNVLRVFKSGAEATAVQTLTRLSQGPQSREAFGLRRVYRRFLPYSRLFHSCEQRLLPFAKAGQQKIEKINV